MISFETTGGTSISLKNPILGDNEQLNVFTVFKTTMSKSVYTTKKTPSRSKFLLNFQNVEQTNYLAFITWYQASRGKTITYTDYNGDTHLGVITNNPVELTVDGRMACTPVGQKELANITIEFEAVN